MSNDLARLTQCFFSHSPAARATMGGRAILESVMVARLYDNGCEVRVDLGNTGRNWPNCPDQTQPGFSWLSFGADAWNDAEAWARRHGATQIVRQEYRCMKSS